MSRRSSSCASIGNPYSAEGVCKCRDIICASAYETKRTGFAVHGIRPPTFPQLPQQNLRVDRRQRGRGGAEIARLHKYQFPSLYWFGTRGKPYLAPIIDGIHRRVVLKKVCSIPRPLGSRSLRIAMPHLNNLIGRSDIRKTSHRQVSTADKDTNKKLRRISPHEPGGN